MNLKLNSMYKTETGYLVPRSHLKEENGEKYAIVQILTGCENSFTSKYATMTRKQMRAALGIPKNERVEIL